MPNDHKKDSLLTEVCLDKVQSNAEECLSLIMKTASNLIDKHDLHEISIDLGPIRLSCKSKSYNSHSQGCDQIPELTKSQQSRAQNSGPHSSTHGGLTEIRSDCVGTVYLSSSPNENPYIMVGSRITVGQTIFIVEAMKVMNHFKSPCNGVVKEILVRNEQVIEYGQVLVKVE